MPFRPSKEACPFGKGPVPGIVIDGQCSKLY